MKASLIYSKFFILDGCLLLQDIQAHHKVVIQPEKCFHIISRAHEVAGHKAIFATLSNLWQRFWWPMLEEDMKWLVSTCHPCQTQQLSPSSSPGHPRNSIPF